jgi:hypothetical protein
MGWLPGGRLAALRVGIRRAEPPDHLHVPGVGFVEGADQFREINWAGDSLFLWLWSDEAIAPADLPRIALIDLDRARTHVADALGGVYDRTEGKRWIRVRVPLARFTSTSLKPFATNRLSAIVLAQGVADDRPVYQEEHAAQLIKARRRRSPHRDRIHLRRSVDRPFAFPLQSNGGPYIPGTTSRADISSSTVTSESTCTPRNLADRQILQLD